MKKLLFVVAVGCSLSSITSAALAEGRQGPPHWPPPSITSAALAEGRQGPPHWPPQQAHAGRGTWRWFR